MKYLLLCKHWARLDQEKKKIAFASDLKEERTKYWELQREQGCSAGSPRSIPDSAKPDTDF